jgi:4-amino-4-deoxy-L-arabinose transferase-like glycosyltransferase
VRVGFLGLALGVLLSVGLGVSPFLDFTSNEGRYAEVAREMVISGDWMVPRLNGQAMLTKPPLLYWLTALAFRLGAVDERARIVSVLAAVIAVVGTYRLGQLLLGPPHGALAGTMLMTMLGFGIEARTLRPDCLLLALVVLTVLCWVESRRREGRARTWCLVGMYVALGLGELTKGLVAIVVVAPVVAGLAWWEDGGRGLRALRPWLGVTVLLLLCAPWHAVVNVRQPGFLWDQFVNQHLFFFFDRKLPRDSEGISLPAFWGAFCFRSAPWLVLVPLAARRARPGRRPDALPWLWFAWVLAFFSFAPSRLEHYSEPALPAVALLAASGTTQLVRTHSSAWSMLLGLSAILLVAGLVGLVVGPRVLARLEAGLALPALGDLVVAAGVTLVVSGALAGAAALRRSSLAWTAALGVGAAAFSVIIVSAEGRLAPLLSWKPVAETIAREMPPDTQIVFEATEEYQVVGGLAYYARRPIALLEPAGFVPPTFLQGETPRLFLDRAEFRRRWRSERPVVLVTDPSRGPPGADLDVEGSSVRIGRVWLVSNSSAATARAGAS